jgi:hypothetical protein
MGNFADGDPVYVRNYCPRTFPFRKQGKENSDIFGSSVSTVPTFGVYDVSAAGMCSLGHKPLVHER